MTRICILISCLLAAGCGSSPSTVNPTVYVLQAQVDPARAEGPGQRVLLVAPPRAEAGFNTERIAYTDTPSTISYYTQSEWADTPAKLLTPLLVQTLEKTGVYRAVVPLSTPVAADHRLDVELIRLQQNFLRQPSQVHLTLRVSLSDINRNTVIATRLFDTSEPAPSEDASGGVQAANQALGLILGELAGWVINQANPS